MGSNFTNSSSSACSFALATELFASMLDSLNSNWSYSPFVCWCLLKALFIVYCPLYFSIPLYDQSMPACNEVHLLRYFTWVDFLLSTCNEVHYFKITFTCDEVHLEGNFRNVTKYRCRQANVSKAILFSAVNCHLWFYSLIQIMFASSANLCSIKEAANLWSTSIAFSWHPPSARGPIHSAL